MGPPARRGQTGQKSKQPKRNTESKNSSSSSNKLQLSSQVNNNNNNNIKEVGGNGASKNIETKALPIPLQQLLLNVYRCGLVQEEEEEEEEEGKIAASSSSLLLSEQVQILKTHLYKRDFVSAFTDADTGLLRAYALRWSAGRALCYAGVFAGVWDALGLRMRRDDGGDAAVENGKKKHVVCIGGGGGAEIVGLAAALRAHWESAMRREGEGGNGEGVLRRLSVTAVDIADWSSLVTKLSDLISSDKIPSSKSCPAPLVMSSSDHHNNGAGGLNVSFKQADVLGLSKEDLSRLMLSKGQTDMMVTLMFTLNELLSTSLPKTTAFLLSLTELLEPGTILLVVDSPGSYSTVSLGGSGSASQQQRSYPMRFLLEHTLLTTAEGEWECLLSDESRWFRRDAARLRYEVGGGFGLEDMRFQIHVYRKLGS